MKKFLGLITGFGVLLSLGLTFYRPPIAADDSMLSYLLSVWGSFGIVTFSLWIGVLASEGEPEHTPGCTEGKR